jgi:long-chain fatty acid transport protein
VKPKTEFNNEGTTNALSQPIKGNDGGDAGGLAAVPHAYFSHQLDNQVWLGLAINVPFGLTTEYKSDWVGRYHAIKSEVKTVNINPSIAYKLNNQVSVAAGVSAMYLAGHFTNAVDFGLLTGNPANAPLLDGKLDIEGDSWGFGANVGILFEPSAGTRIGVHYRSEVEQNIEGDADFKNVPAVPALQAVFVDSDVKADVDLPATLSVSGFHQINNRWAVVGDYTWTGWSSIPELRFKFDSLVPDGVTTFDWKDTSRVSLGAIFTPDNSDWTYRFGVAYDESPIKDAESRSARLPDNDRIWVAVGAGFSPRANLKVDIGYAHLFIDDAKIAKTATGEDELRGALTGTYEAHTDILAIEARYTF